MSDREVLERVMEAMEGRYYGKYRGEVVDNNDPRTEGRLLVKVAGVMGQETLWALPCMPYAGAGVGFFALPPVGARIWVEFEGGDTDYPIWVGCYWLPGELPAEDATPDIVFLRTPGATIRIEESGTLEIEQSANGGATELTAGGFDAMNGALKVV